MYRKKPKDPDRHQKGICLMYIMYNWICSRIFTEFWFTECSWQFPVHMQEMAVWKLTD